MPVPLAIRYCDRKYDNFNDDGYIETGTDLRYNSSGGFSSTNSSATILSRIQYLADKFPNENLCIITYDRLRNYKHNYYGCEYYHYIFCYHAGIKEWTTYEIEVSVGGNQIKKITGLPIGLAPIDYGTNGSLYSENGCQIFDYRSMVYATRRIEGGYEWISPLNKIEEEYLETKTRYYGNLRTIPEVETTLSSNSITIDNIKFSVYDAAAPIITGNTRLLRTFSGKQNSSSNIVTVKCDGLDDMSLSLSSGEVTYDKLIGRKAFYMGETASYFATPIDSLANVTCGAYEVAGFNQTGNASDYKGGSSNKWTSPASSDMTTDSKDVSTLFLEDPSRNLDYVVNAVKMIYPLGGQGGFSSTNGTNDYFYFKKGDGTLGYLDENTTGTTWASYTGLMSSGIRVYSKKLGVDKFFSNYKVTRKCDTSGAINTFVSTVQLYKGKDGFISEDWAVVSVDGQKIGSNSYYAYVFVGYADGTSKSFEFTTSTLDISSKVSLTANYEYITSSANNLASGGFTLIV